MRCFGATIALSLILSSCASGGDEGRVPDNGTLAGSGGGGGTSIGPVTNPDGGPVEKLAGTITSDAAAGAVTVSGQTAQIHFQVALDDGTTPVVAWAVDDTHIGSIASDGTFTAKGYVGGVVTVTATVGTRSTSAKITVTVDITDAKGVADADQTALKAGGSGDAKLKWLYPYDRTVFPRGLAAPTLQLDSTAATATYLKITAPYFSYQGFASASVPLQITIPDAIWQGVTATAGAADAVKVEVTKLSGTEVTGPVAESWFVAQGTLKGIVYYSTYKSPLTNDHGGVMRIRAGQTAEVVQSGCTVCHSVSANGSVLAAGIDNKANTQGDWNPVTSATYDLTPAGTVSQRTVSQEGRTFTMAALTPDGSKALVSGMPPKTWPPFIEHGVYATNGFASSLVDTKTGLDIAAPSLGSLVKYAITPAFSPDGAHVAFSNGDKLDHNACVDIASTQSMCHHVLTLLDFDGKASPPAFSNSRDLIDQTGARKTVAYPTFLPDSNAIVYHEGDSFDSSGFVADGNAQSPAQYAEVRLLETDTKTVKPLKALNGYNAAGDLYLPYGATVEGQMNYEPNVLPLAVGGYYWVLFTSRRAYGNIHAPAGTMQTKDPATTPGKNDPWGTNSVPSWRKKLWIAAIDIDHPTKDDPSHPAFYLPGQEVESANMRAFAALAPCKADGASCESGSDCCNGFCRQTTSADGGSSLACVPPPNTCANTDEPCVTEKDCCNATDLCINNRCSTPPADVR
jgi:hypothetical protein